MRRRLLLSAPLLALPLLRTARAAGAPLRVVATFSILADLVHQVGGDQVAVTSLVGPGADVHTFQPKPSDLNTLRTADVVVSNGLGLEGWLERLVKSSGFKGRRIVASTGIDTRTFKEDGKTVTDPHIWQDPKKARDMALTIAVGLAVADKANEDAYTTAVKAFREAVAAADKDIQAKIDAIPKEKREIITTHDAFGYYGARYGVVFRAAQGISTEAEPTARGMAKLAAQIRHDHVRAVFVEAMTSPRLAETLAREAGAIVGPPVFSDSLSPPGGPAATYLDMLRYNTAEFTKAMAAQ